MNAVVGQTAALHIAFWRYDPWYRRAWLIWPQIGAVLLASWLLADREAVPIGKWAKPADCSNASSPGCAATRRVLLFWEDEVARPTIANQTTVAVDRSAFRSSTDADRSKLSAALGAYYRRDSARAVDILKSATSTDPNVQFVTALALLIPSTTDQVRDAQSLLRNAAAAGHRQAGGVLGRILIAGSGGLPKDEVAGRKLIEDAAAAGDTYAMRLAAAGYANRELGGTYDSVKAVDLLRRAADAGEPVAMAQLAYCISTGRGGLVRDESKVLDYLRRSAEAGYLVAQFALGRWFTQRYSNREIEDPSEGIRWYERAYQRGYSVSALVDLANVHRFARATPWFDTRRSFELLQRCAPYKYLHCQYWLARAHHDGAGTPQDLVKAYAHYTVAKELGRQEAATELQKLDNFLQPAAKTSAAQLATSISAGLRPAPRVIFLRESPEAEAAGPSPWTTPSAPPAAAAPTALPPAAPPAAPSAAPPAVPSSPGQQPSAANDRTTCEGNNADLAIVACARLIGSGIAGTELGEAYYFKGKSLSTKKRYEEAISDFGRAIEVSRAKPALALNDRGATYLQLGNLDAALRDFEEATRIDSSYALAYENRAYVHLRRNRFDEAIAAANTAVQLNPKRERAFWIRGVAYEAKGQWTAVIYECTTALEFNSKYEDCLSPRGWANFKLRKNDAALADFDEALRLQPQFPVALDRRGIVYEAMGNLDAAFRDYEKAAALGNADGMSNLATLYRKGQGVAKDPGAALRWYEKAAEKGHAPAMGRLGSMHLNGEGTPKSSVEAKAWYEKAAALGNAWSMTELGMMYQQGNGVPQNYAEARRWYEKAAALGEPWALYNLGVMHEYGQGVGKSKTEAINWYEKAAAGGHPDASRKLQALR